MNILAFDPGTHTGFAWLADGRAHYVATLYNDDYADTYRAIQQEFRRMINLPPAHVTGLVVVIERFFSVSPAVAASKDGVLTQKFAGFIEGLAVTLGLPVVWQNSSVRMAFVREANEQLATHRATPHEISALAHALAYWHRTHDER